MLPYRISSKYKNVSFRFNLLNKFDSLHYQWTEDSFLKAICCQKFLYSKAKNSYIKKNPSYVDQKIFIWQASIIGGVIVSVPVTSSVPMTSARPSHSGPKHVEEVGINYWYNGKDQNEQNLVIVDHLFRGFGGWLVSKYWLIFWWNQPHLNSMESHNKRLLVIQKYWNLWNLYKFLVTTGITIISAAILS